MVKRKITLTDQHRELLIYLLENQKGGIFIGKPEVIAKQLNMKKEDIMNALSDLQEARFIKIVGKIAEEEFAIKYISQSIALDYEIATGNLAAKEYEEKMKELLQTASKNVTNPWLLKMISTSYLEAKAAFSRIAKNLLKDQRSLSLDNEIDILNMYLEKVQKYVLKSSDSRKTKQTTVLNILRFAFPESFKIVKKKVKRKEIEDQLTKAKDELEIVKIRIIVEGENAELLERKEKLESKIKELTSKLYEEIVETTVNLQEPELVNNLLSKLSKLCSENPYPQCAAMQKALNQLQEIHTYIAGGMRISREKARKACNECLYFIPEQNFCTLLGISVETPSEAPPCEVT